MDRSQFPNFTILDQNLDWAFWEPTRVDPWSTWVGHIPFAHWLMKNARPRVLVELGTYSGVSFAAFCNGARRSRLSARIVAVDAWIGDIHTGALPEWMFAEVTKLANERFPDLAVVLRKTFDEALADVEDGSVDILHIDGQHTYEDVRHDFESWFPKLSSRGVVLFHDVAVREEDFGVWRLWAELTERWPGFAFDHDAGLGVLQVGPDAPEPIKALCGETDPAIRRLIANRFQFLGGRFDMHKLLLLRQHELDTALRGTTSPP